MQKSIIGSLASALLLGSTVLSSPLEDPRVLARITQLEGQVHEVQKQGRKDPQLLEQLAQAYYAGHQFTKGRITFNQIISLYEHDHTAVSPTTLLNVMVEWGTAEDIYARDRLEAERVQLKMLAFLDKLPANSSTRIEAHRIMVRVYRTDRREKEADQQMQQLAKLMGTTDSNLLLPPPHCPGCGRG